MPRQLRMEVTLPSGHKETIQGDVSDEDWDTLLGFRDEAQAMAQALQSCGELNATVQLKWDRDKGISATGRVPDLRDVYTLLHRLRPFVLQREPFEFNRAVNILKSALRHPLVERALRRYQEHFSFKEFQRQVRMTVNEVMVNSEELLQDWLNAHEYHRDRGKQERLAGLGEVLPPEMLHPLFVSMMITKADCVLAFSGLIDAIERGGGTTVQLPLAPPRQNQEQ